MQRAEGIRANLPQFALLVGINALVGALVGQERSLVPLLAEEEFGLSSAVTTTAFLVTFGLAKAPTNLIAGILADRIGRKRVLVAGWLIGLPVPLLLMSARSWTWVIVANFLLGINQGLTWSSTVLMKIDIAGPRRRGLAVGMNECAGYVAVGVSAFVSGLLAQRYGIDFEPFVPGLIIVSVGLVLSWAVVKDTTSLGDRAAPSPGAVLALFGHRRLMTCARTGLMNNANDAFAWALLPLLLVRSGLSTAQVAIVAGTYPVVWGLLQLVTGPLSDRVGRRAPVVSGMFLQALGLLTFAFTRAFTISVLAAAVMGLGTALAYPALIAHAADVAPDGRRASAVGFFRMWRDAGYAIGALVLGGVADLWGLPAAAAAVAALTAVSAIDAAFGLTRADTRTPATPAVAA